MQGASFPPPETVQISSSKLKTEGQSQGAKGLSTLDVKSLVSAAKAAINNESLVSFKKVDESKIHYNKQEPGLVAKLHQFIQEVIAFVKGQSKEEHKNYDLNTHQGVAEKLLTKYSKEEIGQALETLKNSNDMRFNGKEESQFVFDHDNFKQTLENAKDQKIFSRKMIEAPVIDLEDLEVEKPEDRLNPNESAVKEIAVKLAALVERKPVMTEFTAQDGKKCSMKQEVGHVHYNQNNEARFIKGTTSSAEAQKKEKVNELANQGSVVLTRTGVDGEPVNRFLVGRSARTSSEGQVRDSSIGIISDKFQAEGAKGFPEKKDAEGNIYYEFQKVDFSFMDSSLSKQAAGRLLSGYGSLFKGRPLEDEKMFNERHLQAIENKWNPANPDVKKDERGIYIEHKIYRDGELKTFREYKPLFMNVVVSSQANDKSKLEAAHKTNVANAANMGNQLIQKMASDSKNDSIKKELTAISTTLKKCEKNPSLQNTKKLKMQLDNLKAQAPKIVGGPLVDPFPPNIMLAITGIEALVTGSVRGQTVHSVAGSKAQILYSFAIADALQMGASVKCKSGNDRTAIGVCLRTASAQYEEVHGVPFDPMTRNEIQKDEFARYFFDSMESFGRSNVYASRGPSSTDNPNPVLKSKSHPLLNHEKENLNDVEGERFDQFLNSVNLK